MDHTTKEERKGEEDSETPKEETRSEQQGVPTRNRKAARGESLSVSAKVAFHVSFFAGSAQIW